MPLRLFSLLMMVLVLGGCTGYSDPDFDKPLIVLPEDKDTNTETNSTNSVKEVTTPPQQRAWVEAKTSRIWVSPHVDENGDYVEGYYKYLVLDPGHWNLNGNETK